MSKSRKMLIIIGLAYILAPTITAPHTMVDEYMEEQIVTTRTKEIVEDIDFISTNQEEIVETNTEQWIEVNIHVSYYTSLTCENTSYGAVDAKGNPLRYGTIAIPRDLPLGTRFQIDGFDGEFIGTDRGSTKYIKWIDDTTMKIDMLIPRNKGENDNTYYKRVNNMGITKTTGRYLIKDGEQ